MTPCLCARLAQALNSNASATKCSKLYVPGTVRQFFRIFCMSPCLCARVKRENEHVYDNTPDGRIKEGGQVNVLGLGLGLESGLRVRVRVRKRAGR